MKKLLVCIAVGASFMAARPADNVRYGTGLPATGSPLPAHTVFTCPGSDCSTSVNVSWASPNGVGAYVYVTEEGDSAWAHARRFDSVGHRCLTFDSLYSKLGDNADVYERHDFARHGVTLSGLKPSTRYKYKIVTPDYQTDTRCFVTAGDSVWKAAVIGDFHHYSPLWRRLDAAMAMIGTLDSVSGGFDWILSPGDQCAWGGSYNYWTELSEQPAYKNYMWGAVEGNHDHMSGKTERSDAFFRDTHHNPLNGYTGQEGVVYHFKYGDVLFIMLNNEAMRDKESLDKAIGWIRATVAENPSRYIVVVEHYEWLIGSDGSDSQLDRFRDVFDELGVDLAVSGNNHAYLRTLPLYGRQPVPPAKGTTYVVTPSSDNSRGRALKPLAANEDIIAHRWSEGSKTVGAMILDVSPARLVMTLYDRYGNVQDSFTIPSRR